MTSMLMYDDDENQKPGPRSGHVFCQLKDSIFMWGGYNNLRQDQYTYHRIDVDLSIVWFYYPLARKWIKMKLCFPPYPKIYKGSGAIYMPSKQSVYLFFGYSDYGPKNCIYSFDTVQYKWSCINEGTSKNKHNPSPRCEFALWEFRNKIYIFGGLGFTLSEYLHDKAEFDENYEPLRKRVRGWNNQLLEFDVETEKWREVPHSGIVPCPRYSLGATRVKDKVYVFGGKHKGNETLNDLHQLDLSNMAWTRIVSDITPSNRSWHTFGHLSDNRHLVIIGGWSDRREVLDDIWLYDIETNIWTEHSRPSSNTKRMWQTMSVTEDDDVVIFGGCKVDICSRTQTHTNDLVILRFSPDTLFRLAVQIVIKNRNIFADQLSNIPDSCKNLVMETWQIMDSPYLQIFGLNTILHVAGCAEFVDALRVNSVDPTLVKIDAKYF